MRYSSTSEVAAENVAIGGSGALPRSVRTCSIRSGRSTCCCSRPVSFSDTGSKVVPATPPLPEAVF